MSDVHSQPRRIAPASLIPEVHSVWTLRLMSLAMLAAMMPPLAVSVYRFGSDWLYVPVACVLVTIFWQAFFTLAKRRSMPIDGVAVGLAFAIMAGPSVPIWQAALAMSFGVVVGEQIFGGRGHAFLNPTVVALSFFMFSFPNATIVELDPTLALAVIPGALLLLVFGLISWRIVVSAAAGLVAVGFAIDSADPLVGLTTGAFAFGLVFFACDPVASPSINPGRWMHGILFGALAVLLAGGASAVSSRSVVFAALLASVLAPLIDQLVVWVNARRRRQRHG